jgi:hypothetical protein
LQASPVPRGDTPGANPSGSKTAEERFGISLSLSSARLEVAPGSTARLEARVRNLGVLVNEITVLVDGAPRPWVHVEPERIGILPGAAEVVSLTFAPPSDVEMPAGPVPFRAIARSELHQGALAEEYGVLDLARMTEVNLDVCPDRQRARRSADYQVVLASRSNHPLSVELRLGGSQPLLQASFTPSVLTVPAFGTARAVLCIEGPCKNPDDSRPYPFQVQALLGDGRQDNVPDRMARECSSTNPQQHPDSLARRRRAGLSAVC